MKIEPVAKREPKICERADGAIRNSTFRFVLIFIERLLGRIDLLAECSECRGGLCRIDRLETAALIFKVIDHIRERKYRRHFGDLFFETCQFLLLVIEIVFEKYEVDLLVVIQRRIVEAV